MYFLHKSREITQLKIYEILNTVVLPYSYVQTNYTEDIEKTQFFTYIKGNNSVQKSRKFRMLLYKPRSYHTIFYQNSSICSKDIEQNAILIINQVPQLCNYLTKFTHLQSQDTPSQYQVSCKV